MTSYFLNAFGADIDAVRRSVGATGGTMRSAGNNGTDVIYVALPRATMFKFRNFYTKEETDIANANGIKDFYTLNDNVSFSFGTQELDDEKYAITKPLCALMSAARAWHDMFGFVAIYNPDIRADRRVRELRQQAETGIDDQGVASTSYGSQYASALEMPDLLLAEATRLIKDSLTTDRESVKRKIIGDDVDQVSLGVKRPRRSNPIGVITQNPRYSNFKNPGAVLRIIDKGARRGDEEVRVASTDEISYQEQQAREQTRNARRTMEETLIGLRNLKVVELEDGHFYLEIDRASMTRRVVFARTNITSTGGARNGNTPTDTVAELADRSATGQTVHIDPDVFVYVWPNRMPFSDGELNSKMYEVLRRREALDQAERNAADVDLTNSHPLQYLEHVPVTPKLAIENMTNLQMYGGPGGQATTEALEAVRRDAIMSVQLQAAAALANKKNLTELGRLVASGRVTKTLLDANGEPNYPEFVRMGYLPLPSGYKLGSAARAEVSVDTEVLAYRFRRALSNALGVPIVLLDGGSSFSGRASKNSSGSTSAGASTASQAISDTRLRNTILAGRITLRNFMDNIWDIMYRQIDNETLETLVYKEANAVRDESETHLAEMRLIKKRLQTIVDLSEQDRIRADLTTRWNEIQSAVARLRDLSSRVRQIVVMQHRFRVDFKSLSFIPPAELAAAQGVAISKRDYADAVRANFGMSKLTDAEFKKISSEILDEQVEQMEAQAKVQNKYAIPTGTGGAKKPPKITPPTAGKAAAKK